MNIFHTSRLPTGLKQDTLARMVRTLLLRLVDDNLGKQPEGEALLKVRAHSTPVRMCLGDSTCLDLHWPLTRCLLVACNQAGCTPASDDLGHSQEVCCQV